MTPEMLPVMHLLEAHQAKLWESLYDPGKLYIVDRSIFVSGRVYSAVYGRPYLVDWCRWRKDVRVLYIQSPVRELRRRLESRGDDCFDARNLERVIAEYERIWDWSTWSSVRYSNALADSLEGIRLCQSIVKS